MEINLDKICNHLNHCTLLVVVPIKFSMHLKVCNYIHLGIKEKDNKLFSK